MACPVYAEYTILQDFLRNMRSIKTHPGQTIHTHAVSELIVDMGDLNLQQHQDNRHITAKYNNTHTKDCITTAYPCVQSSVFT